MTVEIVDNRALAITGSVFRTAKVRDDPYDCVDDPQGFIDALKEARLGVDLFTFMQEIADRDRKHPFHLECESLAVLPITTYEHWWKKQISDKARNKIRKAQKRGVEVRPVVFNDEFVGGIVKIYDESPLRQGKRFVHYRKDFETIKRDHGTFIDRSDFIGAYQGNELIGFVKLVHGRNVSSLMQIISTIASRDHAPTNALIAKAVEICADKKISGLHYGVWSRSGLGVFKINHGFTQWEVPRYFVPLNFKGQLMLRLKLHHKLRDRLPEKWLDSLVSMRTRWNSFRLGKKAPDGA